MGKIVLSQLLHLGQDILRLGETPLVHLLEADDTLLVNDDHRTPADSSFLVVDAVQLGNLALRVKIGQYGVWDVPQRRTEGTLHRSTIHANAQDLGILLLKPAVFHPESGDLVGSAPGEGGHVKGENHMFLASVLAQGHILSMVRTKGKIRGLLAYIYHRVSPLLMVLFVE
jgi:hypothetical protein